jgi:hypothetical protein
VSRGWELFFRPRDTKHSPINSSRKAPGGLRCLEHHAFVAFTASDMFPIEEFEQRNGVLSRDAGPFLEGADVEARGFTGTEHGSQFGDRGLVKDEVLADADETLFSKKDFQDAPRAGRLDAGFREDFGEGRNGEPRVGECFLDGLFGLRLLFF